jgi:hypothetical protein
MQFGRRFGQLAFLSFFFSVKVAKFEIRRWATRFTHSRLLGEYSRFSSVHSGCLGAHSRFFTTHSRHLGAPEFCQPAQKFGVVRALVFPIFVWRLGRVGVRLVWAPIRCVFKSPASSVERYQHLLYLLDCCLHHKSLRCQLSSLLSQAIFYSQPSQPPA